jgi:hypothetical protein
MGGHWSQRKYIDADSIWSFIDEQTAKLDLLVQNDDVESSELCKLLMLGRREMLSAVCDCISEHESTLEYIVTDRHEIFTREELKKHIARDFTNE